jgi:hypothetical protein
MTGIELIAAERKRQIDEEGWTAEGDDKLDHDELANAAVCYAVPEDQRDWYLLDRFWLFGEESYKPTPDNRIRELTKAGALIAAEIDRLLRLEEKTKEDGNA